MENRTTIQVSEDLRKKLRVLAAGRDVNYQQILSDMIDVFNELDHDKTIISLPTKLSEKIKENIKDSEFSSISEYVTFMLRIMMYENIKTKDQNLDKIKNRLQKLGYLD